MMEVFPLSHELHLDPGRLSFITAVAHREWIVTSASTKLHAGRDARSATARVFETCRRCTPALNLFAKVSTSVPRPHQSSNGAPALDLPTSATLPQRAFIVSWF